MSHEIVKCPKCGTEIKVAEALAETIRDSLKASLDAEAAEKQAELLKHRRAVIAKEKELAEREQNMEDALEERLSSEREMLTQAALRKAEKEYSAKAKSLEAELEKKSETLAKAEQKELELLKAQRDLEEAKRSVELNVERKLAEVSKTIQEEASKRAEEAQHLKLREKDSLIETLRTQMADMQRRAEVGSQEAQGEALEGQLLDSLTASFPFDSFEEVKKGARGGDIVQLVRNPAGAPCGRILWETKNTKDFQNAWFAKLKKDQQACGADVAVLMSMVLPKDVKDFAFNEGENVWVTGFGVAIGLCVALRQTLIRVARERAVSQHRDTFKDFVYDYITGQDFAHRVRAIADAYRGMQADLDAEKRAINRIWKKREKQIAIVLDNVTEMHGELEGLAGGAKALPPLEPMMLESIVDEDDEESDGA